MVTVSKVVAGSVEVQTFEWIQKTEVVNRALVTALELELHSGEAEAIALAIELNADLLLLDERQARIVASCFGLKFTGILGILIESKHKGIISAVKPVLDDLIAIAGFWITKSLYQRVLESVGE
jgi:predicted nucleic acid-binding protein